MKESQRSVDKAPIQSTGEFITRVTHRTSALEGANAHKVILDTLQTDERIMRRAPKDVDPDVYRREVLPTVKDAILKTENEIERMHGEVSDAGDTLRTASDLYHTSRKEVSDTISALSRIPRGTEPLYEPIKAEEQAFKRIEYRLHELPWEVGDFPGYQKSTNPTEDYRILTNPDGDTNLSNDSGKLFHLSPKERAVMELFTSDSTQKVSGPELAEIVFGDYTIRQNTSKLIHGLRTKFGQEGPSIASDVEGYWIGDARDSTSAGSSEIPNQRPSDYDGRTPRAHEQEVTYTLADGSTFYGDHGRLLRILSQESETGYHSRRDIVGSLWPDVGVYEGHQKIKRVLRETRQGLADTAFYIDGKRGLKGGTRIVKRQLE